LVGLLLAAAAALLIAAQAREDPPIAPIRFRNVAASAGIDFVLENSATPRSSSSRPCPAAVVAFDYDGDGRIDIFFTNGAAIHRSKKSREVPQPLFATWGGCDSRTSPRRPAWRAPATPWARGRRLRQ